MLDKNELLLRAQKLFLADFEQGLTTLFTHTEEALFDLAERSKSILESGRCFDSRALLVNKRDDLTKDLTTTLASLSDRSLRTAYDSFRPTFGGKFAKANELSLIDASAFEEELLIDELTTKLSSSADEALRELNTRIAILFDQDEILERENPFRPFLFSKTLLNGIDALNPPAEVHETLVVQLHHQLLPLVKQIYQDLNQLFADHGIASALPLRIRKADDARSNHPQEMGVPEEEPTELPAASFVDTATSAQQGVSSRHVSSIQGMSMSSVDQLMEKIRQRSSVSDNGFAPDGKASAGGSFSGSEGAYSSEHSKPGLGRAWSDNFQRIGQTIRNFFSGAEELFGNEEGGGYIQQASEPLIASVSRQAIANQHVLQTLANEQGPSGTIRNLVMEQREQLQEDAQNDSERMIIDIVAMLFEFILSDQEVPSEIRAQIGRLQFVVLKIALREPRLFNERTHPARLLVNKLGLAPHALHDIDPGGEQLTQFVKTIINELVDDNGEHLSLFEEKLSVLETFIEDLQAAADSPLKDVEDYVNQAEERTERFARISAMIASSLTGIKLDYYLYEFLVYPWARVLEKTSYSLDKNEPLYRRLIPELIWSIAPKQSDEDRATLLKMIPRLIKVLKLGLEQTSWSTEKKLELQNWLVAAHTQALRPTTNLSVTIPPLAYFMQRLGNVLFDAAWEPTIAPTITEMEEQKQRQFFNEVIQELEVSLQSFSWQEDTEEPPTTDELSPSVITPDVLTAISTTDVTPNTEVMKRLKAGVAVSLKLGATPSVAVLHWVSKQAKHFAMTIQGQTKPVILGAKVFMRLINSGRIKFLDDNPLFERAVEALIRTADDIETVDQLQLH